ncbi:MAG: hypothetical protein EOO52_13245 [Gammaproteobacteria bacterium]|nr:MAG: hypothetical protein EOO52_13245 [Gammaproteobacteria bacterium]
MSQQYQLAKQCREEGFNSFLSELVANAMASLNERSDTILNEIRDAHDARMWQFELREDALERDRIIADGLHPHSSFNNWWDSLKSEERESWNDSYQKFQYGTNGGEEFHGCFQLAVINFLHSRDEYYKTPFCAFCDSRHAEPGSCMKSNRSKQADEIECRYHLSIIGDKPWQYNGIEVHGVRDIHTDQDDREGTCFEIDDDDPELYSVYLHCVAGGIDCVGDFSLLLDAKKYARDLELLYSWPSYTFCNEIRPN